MTDFAEVLERFNRKERNLLIRDALGISPGSDPLSEDFRQRVGDALGLAVPQTASWWTDYHLNWIIGALTVRRDGETAIGRSHDNPIQGTSALRLIQSNQEDVDLLISFDQTLILTEVKAYGYFSNTQIRSKVHRWQILFNFDKAMPDDLRLDIKILLMSRTAPKRLEPLPDDFGTGERELRHAILDLHTSSKKLTVTGKAPGNQTVDGQPWSILPLKSDEFIDEAALL